MNDALLMKVASRSQGQLLKVRVSQSTLVTDAGLSALIAAAPQLQELTLEELSRKVGSGPPVGVCKRPPSPLPAPSPGSPHERL